MSILKIHWKIKALQWFEPNDKKNLNINFENVQEGIWFFKMLLGIPDSWKYFYSSKVIIPE